METLQEALLPAVRISKKHAAHLPPRPLANFILPLAVSALGGALGIATGIFLGVQTTPPANLSAANQPAQAMVTTVQPEVPIAGPSDAQPVRLDSATSAPESLPASRGEIKPLLQPATVRTVRQRGHRSKSIAISISGPVIIGETTQALLVQALSDQLDTENTSSITSILMIEGDLQVVDFDTSAGKLETRGGPSFMLNASDVSSAADWSDDRVDVHYRCGQSGLCILNGPGAPPLHVRQI